MSIFLDVTRHSLQGSVRKKKGQKAKRLHSRIHTLREGWLKIPLVSHNNGLQSFGIWAVQLRLKPLSPPTHSPPPEKHPSSNRQPSWPSSKKLTRASLSCMINGCSNHWLTRPGSPTHAWRPFLPEGLHHNDLLNALPRTPPQPHRLPHPLLQRFSTAPQQVSSSQLTSRARRLQRSGFGLAAPPCLSASPPHSA